MARGRFDEDGFDIPIKKIVIGIITVVVLIVGAVFSGNLVESVDANEIVIMQDPVDGELHYWIAPGLYYQNFGRTTHYLKSNQYWFSYENDPSKRFELSEDILGNAVKFLKPNTVLEAIIFEDKVITAELPIKMEFKIIEAPPSIRGDTAQGGVKQAKIETGAYINVPLFIDESDIIRVNTETGEYVERVEKGK